jgi:hypothetical protein
MTILERDKLRAEVLKRHLDLAYVRAAEYGLSGPCREAMHLTGSEPGRARELHAACGGEDPMGLGCLCLCHDVRDTSVATGCSG